MVLRDRTIALIKELTCVWLAAVGARRDLRRSVLPQYLLLNLQQFWEIVAQPRDAPGEIFDGEQFPQIMLLSTKNVFAVEVHYAGGGNVDTASPEYVALYRDIVEIVLLAVDRRFHFDKSPAV
jgi:hypothetical protein